MTTRSGVLVVTAKIRATTVAHVPRAQSQDEPTETEPPEFYTLDDLDEARLSQEAKLRPVVLLWDRSLWMVVF